jgi:hypothetical protein
MATETLNFLNHQVLSSGTYPSPAYAVPAGTITLEVTISVDSASNNGMTKTELQKSDSADGPWETGAIIQSFGNTGASGSVTYGVPSNPLPGFLRTVTTVTTNSPQGGGNINATMQVTAVRTF